MLDFYRKETEECSFEKWNEFPAELKLKCVEQMDFKTRFLLRCTSRSERALVNSQKFPIHKVSIGSSFLYPFNQLISGTKNIHFLTITPTENSETYEIKCKNRFLGTILPLLKYVLKNGIIEKFSIETIRKRDWTEDLEDSFDSLNIKSFRGILLTDKELMFFVNKLKRGTEKFYLDASERKTFPVDELMNNKAFSESKLVQIRDLHCHDIYCRFIKKWIQEDSEVGTTFRMTTACRQAIHEVRTKFRGRIVSESAYEFRFSTNNPKKNIILHFTDKWRFAIGATMTVVSTDSSNYGRLDTWIGKRTMPIAEYLSSFSIDEENLEEADFHNFLSLIILYWYLMWYFFLGKPSPF